MASPRIDDSAVYDEDEDSNTALHLACTNRRAKVAEVLLKNGADVQNRNLMKWTPLDCAAAVGAYNCAKLLLDVSKFMSSSHDMFLQDLPSIPVRCPDRCSRSKQDHAAPSGC